MRREITCQAAIDYECPPDGNKVPVIDPYDGCQLNCAYCFQWNDPTWNQTILVKTNLPEVLDRTLAGWDRTQDLYVGSRGDPYMPLENDYQLTRRTLEVIHAYDVKCYLNTKSNATAIQRDMDLFESFGEQLIVCLGQTNLAHLRETTDPARLPNIQTVKALVGRGVPTWVFITPVLPGITHVQAMIEALPDAVPVYLDKVRIDATDVPGQRFLAYVQHYYPELAARYQALATTGTDPYYEELRSLYQGDDRITFVFGEA